MKVMVFIDGSWLYYSFYGRRPNCPVQKQFGEGWSRSHTVAFDQLPHLISASIQKELLERDHASRFIEVCRTVVFTSVRADTYKNSERMRMFRAMEQANFEVHMSTTTGQVEKCIDISLAVEMMHYAAMPGAYDCAVLVTGDKDFMPALQRIRQRGKRVAICSMQGCCSRDLIDPSSHVRDFEPIWLDNYLHQLVSPRNLGGSAVPVASASELLNAIASFLKSEPEQTASSRDIGRFLQQQTVKGADSDVNMLAQLKQEHGGLQAFFKSFPEDFETDLEEGGRWKGKVGLEFHVTLASNFDDEEQDARSMDAKIGPHVIDDDFDDDEYSSYGYLADEARADDMGAGARWERARGRGEVAAEERGLGGDAASASTAEEWARVEKLTVPLLREELRARGLRLLGKRSELIERLRGDMQAEPPKQQPLAAGRSRENWPQQRAEAAARAETGPRAELAGAAEETEDAADAAALADRELMRCVVGFLQRGGGETTSRTLGRHLAAQGLKEKLKSHYSGLYHFLQQQPDRFRIKMPSDGDSLDYKIFLLPRGE